jgi:small subunit ribosomal protein S10e
MLIPKESRKKIFVALFKDGVMVAKKDFNAPKHSDEMGDIPNLHVIKACQVTDQPRRRGVRVPFPAAAHGSSPSPLPCWVQSLKSRGYVKEQFAWRHYYWYLTDEGVEYLRTYLHLPSEVVPDTQKRQVRAEAPASRPAQAPRSGGFRSEGGESYRRGRFPRSLSSLLLFVLLAACAPLCVVGKAGKGWHL